MHSPIVLATTGGTQPSWPSNMFHEHTSAYTLLKLMGYQRCCLSRCDARLLWKWAKAVMMDFYRYGVRSRPSGVLPTEGWEFTNRTWNDVSCASSHLSEEVPFRLREYTLDSFPFSGFEAKPGSIASTILLGRVCNAWPDRIHRIGCFRLFNGL